jgi:hypothetical protein
VTQQLEADLRAESPATTFPKLTGDDTRRVAMDLSDTEPTLTAIPQEATAPVDDSDVCVEAVAESEDDDDSDTVPGSPTQAAGACDISHFPPAPASPTV